jgi:predicted glycogen debranching enzyme
MKKLLFFSLWSSIALSQSLSPFRPITMDELVVETTFGGSREIAFTNKEAGVFYTETNGSHRTGWQGWRIMSVEMMEDYRIRIDGREINKQDALRTLVYPHQMVREYNGGITETVTFVDSIDALTVEVKCDSANIVEIRPVFSDAQSIEEYEKDFQQQTLLLAKKKHLTRTGAENYPVWLGVTIVTRNGKLSQRSQPLFVNRMFSPASLATTVRHGSVTAIFAFGDTKEQAIKLTGFLSRKYMSHILKRKSRMDRLLNQLYIRSDNEQFNKALQWAKISMDALIMNQVKKGIFAGLPWFDNYWGRDTFISLAGATLVTAKYAEAKEILRSFAEWQDADSNSASYGRIPNLVTTLSKSYNTADGTPRFVIALDDYLRYSGDTSIISEMYPIVKRSIEGTLQYHCDSLYFLTHADAETWMDAVGPNGPWSPRGNRANDIQALWGRQLEIGSRWAAYVNDEGMSDDWAAINSKLRNNFATHFIDTAQHLVFDHLNNDGTVDTQLRPNQLETFELFDGTGKSNELRNHVFKTITEKLVYPYGIASLSQEDQKFHPYHHYPPFYVQDAAYHNGIVWTWLAGKWIDKAVSYNKPDLAFAVTQNMAEQILYRGAVGTLSELLDAVPRKDEYAPRLSGTFSQAWSLAEFIRNFYQSYLGISMDATRNMVNIDPHVPSAMRSIQFALPYQSGVLRGRYSPSSQGDTLVLESKSTFKNISVGVSLSSLSSNRLHSVISIPPNTQLTMTVSEHAIVQHVNGESSSLQTEILNQLSPTIFQGLRLATPVIRPGLKSMKGPDHRMLSNSAIKQVNPDAKKVIDVTDPERDDRGIGGYLYPQTPSLRAGSLDITRCVVTADEQNVYFDLTFRSLSDPGWHPEYGFQLTYVAIAIDKDHTPGSGRAIVGMNSNYTLDDSVAYENIIYAGGGIRVEDSNGKIIAEYLPVSGDENNPLGNIQSRTISFSLPRDVIGNPDTAWRYTILVGAQDDHGGAGIGEFRSVEKEAKEWTGGGKQRTHDPNVYDVIIVQ